MPKLLPFDKFFILSYASIHWPFTYNEGTSMERLDTGIRAGRLSPAEYEDNFSDLHPRLDKHEALVASDRCYFCYDAPCMTACPTSIDIPLFIRQISTGNPLGSAKTIFDQNILGGMCARVCPTEDAVRAGLCAQHGRRTPCRDRPPAALRDRHRHAGRQAVLSPRRIDGQKNRQSSAPARPALPQPTALP
jgi:ferredoxin